MNANGFSLQLLEEAEETSRVQWLLAEIERCEEMHGRDDCIYCRLGRALDGPSLAKDRGLFKKQMLRPSRVRVVPMNRQHTK